jgi:hypothetical protein
MDVPRAGFPKSLIADMFFFVLSTAQFTNLLRRETYGIALHIGNYYLRIGEIGRLADNRDKSLTKWV